MEMLVAPLELATPIAAFNGGLMVDQDMKVLEERALDEDVVGPVADLMGSFDLDVWLYRGADWYVPDPEGPHVDREAWTDVYKRQRCPSASTRPRSASDCWSSRHPPPTSPSTCWPRATAPSWPSPCLLYTSIAYFCVAELLANVAQHALASRASVSCAQQGTWLRLVVRDDGTGGAQLTTCLLYTSRCV